MAENKGILVLGEIAGGQLLSITTELLGCARKLAGELGEGVSCLLAGDAVGNLAKEAIAFGADKVYAAENPELKQYQGGSYMQVVAPVVKEISPRIILLGNTNMGADLAPRLAFRLGVGLATDCLELSLDPATKRLMQTSSVYGGNAQAIFTAEMMPQIATVRTKAMSPIAKDGSRKGEVIPVKVAIDMAAVKTKLVDFIKEEVTGVKLEDAPVIVCGGRGCGGPEPYKTTLKALADVLKGAVGASRPPCDNGWVPEAMHIGLTGKIVAPDIYFAIAISGASQHMSGCTGSKTIIAINKDPEANVFKQSNFGVVGKFEDVVPALTSKLKELLKG